MRLLHVTDTYAPRVGGIELQVQALAERQAAAGHEVHVATRVPGPAGRTRAGVVVHRPARSSSAGRLDLLAADVESALACEPDVVQVHASVFSPLGYLAAAASAGRGVPTVVTVHSLWDWAVAAFRGAHGLVGWRDWPVTWSAVSSVAATDVERALGGHRSVCVLPNGIDADRWRVARQPAPPSRVVVAGVMRLASRKRPLAFVRVLAQARRLLPPSIQLSGVLIGDGPLRAAVHREVRRQGAEGWLSVPGALRPAEIRTLYGGADLYLNPTRLESFGIAALEARCAGLPVVARAGTGVGDFVCDGREGLLARSDVGLVEAVCRLAEDVALRQRISRHNATVAPYCTWGHVEKGCWDLYTAAGGATSPVAPAMSGRAA